MTEQQFILNPDSYRDMVKTLEKGNVTWESPSNIALVKYWGKKKDQIPENPSISFTLTNCKTITTLSFSKKENNLAFSFDVFLDNERKDDFKPKIETFFNRVELYLPFLRDYHFKIETTNTFPHSSGIASSASGMSALALCLMSLEKQLVGTMDESYFNKKASFLARLGSGSISVEMWADRTPSSSIIGAPEAPFEAAPPPACRRAALRIGNESNG